MLKNQGDIRKSIFSKPEDLKKLIFKAKNKDEKMEYFYYIETKNNKDAYFLRMDTFFFDQKI
jgi:hypothetical protein